jgi:iron complex outermembrane receptor protein
MVGVTANPQPAPSSNLPPSGFVPAVPLSGGALTLAAAGRPFAWGGATFLPNLFDPDSRRVAHYSAAALVWDQQLSPRAGYRVSYQLMDSRRDNRDGPGGPGYQPLFNNSSAFNGRIDTLQARADLALSPRHALSAGYEYERERYENPSFDRNPDSAQRVNARTAARQRSHSAFFHDQVRLFSERLQISLSGRWQGFRLERPQFEGGAPQYQGVAFAAPPDAWTGDAAISYFAARTSTKWRAHLGNSYRSPALYERFGAYFFMGAFSALGDPRLRPERSLGLDAGVDQYLLLNRLRLSGTVFYTRLQEVIGYGNTPNDPFGRWGGYLNTGGGLTRGVELSAEARPDRSTLVRASYTHVNADERASTMTGGTLAAIRVFPNTFTTTVTRSFGRRWEAAADFWSADHYIGGTFFVGSGIRPYLFDGPRRLDATAAYTLPLGERGRVRLFLRAENLLGRTYYEEGFRTPGRWASAGLKYFF